MSKAASEDGQQQEEAPQRLYVSLSSIRDTTFVDARMVLADLDYLGVRTALLVAPHVDEQWHLAKDPVVGEWLAAQGEQGRTLVANGFDTSPKGRRSEFATLGQHEARLRLSGAQRQLQSLGFECDIFAPPRWRLSAGTLEVLPEFDFRLALSNRGAFRLGGVGEPPRQVLDARTLSIGEGYGAAGWWRRNVIAAAQRGASKGRTVRLSASAHDLGSRQNRRDLLAAVQACLEAGAVPADYADLGGL